MALSGDVLFELRRLGNAVKITAFHCDSLTEVTVMGPVNTPEAHLKLLALRKLEYVLAKKK
ncbi:hypothetical protein A6A04_17225 [Paramagnetospirillum marisnigri]|uniref:DUF6898 domain-containing protein n=1 Tax=Paramagnetospirillum marisnigri TaxID=1285242 RepID=A0A178MPW3_9PROT|nr:hypothetical protein [Paramagnetospirillum marisnigri]OAN50840.1 hypothetical protein A6A04_17225 [Paramagnetospirillum marisnigri]